MFHYFLADPRVPDEHPLRRIKDIADRALGYISSELDGVCVNGAQAWIAPERLLKGQLLMVLYSISSDQQFCDQLGVSTIYRWFLDMDMESAGLDPANFRCLRERVVSTPLARRFLDGVVSASHRESLLSPEYFNVDRSLAKAWGDVGCGLAECVPKA